MSTISCEAFFIIAHYYSSFDNEAYVSRASKCLDQISKYITERRRREEEIFESFPSEELQKESTDNEQKETAKVLYARVIIAHNSNGSTTASLMSDLVRCKAAIDHTEIFSLCT